MQNGSHGRDRMVVYNQ